MKKKKYRFCRVAMFPISEGMDPLRLLRLRSLHKKKRKKSITKNKSKIIL